MVGLALVGLLAVGAMTWLVGGRDGTAETPAIAQSTPATVAVYGYEVVNTYPHDPEAFTQGLVFLDGVLYEGTGLNGGSTVRVVELETGAVRQRIAIDDRYFGEGLVDWGGTLVQLTWQSGLGFVYDRATLQLLRTFDYEGEGWGLTHDTDRLIMSDGTARLRFLDPDTLVETGSVPVRDGATPLMNINELEYVRGEVYANVWQSDRIAIISPDTGRVTGWIDLRGLLAPSERTAPGAVLNGIAYDAEGDRLFVTGKLWPKLFEIRLIQR